MANARGKHIDNTHLSIDRAEERGFTHRDYITHCHRWSHVVRWLQRKKNREASVVLDIGCGKELPLAKLMYSNCFVPKLYIGVDYNDLTQKADDFSFGRFPIETFSHVNLPSDVQVVPHEGSDGLKFGEDTRTVPSPNVFVSFEVVEHVEPGHARAMLKWVRTMLPEDGHFFLSTPCYDEKVGAASNHVNEMTHMALGALLEDLGFAVTGNYGTFASIKDYKAQLEADGHAPLFNQLREYYDVNVLATIFAPLYPALARNNLWHLTVASDNYTRRFPTLSEVEGPWTSSEQWEDLAHD